MKKTECFIGKNLEVRQPGFTLWIMVIFPGKFLIAELQFPHIANKSTCVTELL